MSELLCRENLNSDKEYTLWSIPTYASSPLIAAAVEKWMASMEVELPNKWAAGMVTHCSKIQVELQEWVLKHYESVTKLID